MKDFLKRILPDLAAIIFFVAVSAAYMLPALSGKFLPYQDTVNGLGASRELAVYQNQTGEISRWTNSIFSGMPSYQMMPSYPATSVLYAIQRTVALFLPYYIWHLFALLLGFYILMRVMKIKPLVSVIGAILWAFSSYFIIAVSVGHFWKITTLAFIPPTIAGMILIYRRKFIAGFFLTALSSTLQLYSNHLQMTYYFLFVMAGFAVVFLIESIKKKEFKEYVISTLIIVLAGCIGICANSSNLYHTYKFSKETVRGGSALKQGSDGLDNKYITRVSYGVDETLTLLIPNAKGGATIKGDKLNSISEHKQAMRKAIPEYKAFYINLPQYFGKQDLVSGPVYVGAVACFLFILGAILVSGPIKWALLTLTLLSILLSWGRNFPWLSNLFISYFPLYSKFRAVSSILVIAQFCIPLLGILGLVKFLDSEEKKKSFKALKISFAITAGISLLIALFPSLMGRAVTDFDNSVLQQICESKQTNEIVPVNNILENVNTVRHGIVSADAVRSFIFISFAFIFSLLFIKGKIKQSVCVVLIAALSLVDLWGVDKRYLSDDMFKRPKEVFNKIKPSDADRIIHKDKSPDYRVLNLTSNTFSENTTSFFHKSIGGYNAAKLSRYQDIIDVHLNKEIDRFKSSLKTDSLPVINMLNTKYFIVPSESGEAMPYANYNILGNAWFVKNLKIAGNPAEAIKLLDEVDLKNVAFIENDMIDKLPSLNIPYSDASYVKINKYKPNEISYYVGSQTGGVAVFSEIYYPGWKARIDGQESNIFRADYILRALAIPPGLHEIVFEYRPDSIRVTNIISFTAFGLLAISLLLFILSILLPKLRCRD